MGLFLDSGFAEDLEDSKSTSGWVSCIFGARTCVSISWMCKKQTSVSHSCTESEMISFDAVQRMDGLLALDLWDVVIEVLRSSNSTKTPTNPAAGNCSRNHKSKPKQKGHRDVDLLSHMDYVTTNANSFQGESQLHIFEDNEAVIKMIIEGRSPSMRHVSRTPQSCAWLVICQNQLGPKDPKKKYVDTKNQLADMQTKGNFTRNEWNHLLRLFHIGHFSSVNSVKAMSKRTQEDAGEERVTAKSKPMTNLVSRCCVRDLDVLASTASENPVKTRYEQSITSELVDWAASKNRETCHGRLLIKLPRVECWQELVFSRVEIWWIDGN